jgi:DNA-binding PadR family transcriptional regulator
MVQLSMWPFRFAMRRKRGLPNMIVYLLSSSPKNGVELMDGVESITRGWWRPTPGSIYPLLKEMSDQGIVKKLADGRYELTSKGRMQMEGSYGPWMRRPETMDDVLGQMQNYVSYMEDLKSSGKDDLDQHAAKLEALSKRLAELARRESPKEGRS